jgi:hypothetical protein
MVLLSQLLRFPHFAQKARLRDLSRLDLPLYMLLHRINHIAANTDHACTKMQGPTGLITFLDFPPEL